MTTEEKAKAYDEALERIGKFLVNEAGRYIIDDYIEGNSRVVYKNKNEIWRKVFPYFEKPKEQNTSASTMIPSCWETEQKPATEESEDERIRKALITIVKRAFSKYGVKCKGDEIGEEDLLTYLERQKEPKPTELERLEKLREMTKEIREAYERGIEVGKRIEQTPVHTAKEMWKEMRLEVYAQASGNRHEPNSSDDSTKMFSLSDIDEIFEKIGDSIVVSQPAEDWREKRENECPFRKTLDNNLFGCERHAGAISICNGRCSWVVNHQRLKEIQDRKEPKRLAPSAVTSADLSVLLNQQNKNKMITEDYVSFETAKLLKEKGFETDDCHTAYDENGEFFLHGDYSKDRHGIVDAPTLQMAMKWLRKVHNFHIRIDRASKYWNYTIRNLKRFGTNDLSYHIVDSNTYEEACESAIKYCLENLI